MKIVEHKISAENEIGRGEKRAAEERCPDCQKKVIGIARPLNVRNAKYAIT